ncbi:MAG: lysophospholipid acyltransferase family protein, partial [Parvularculaceae bacterium]|nr:lysophospholipid acyltransferase family protein [Parvularculaceae bacterium]
ENLGRTGAEFAHLDAFANTARVEIEGRQLVEDARRSGRPMIFVSGHFANWEIMPIALRVLGVDYALVYRAANNPLVDGLIIRERARVATRWQTPKGKGARPLVDALRSGRSLAMLVDQKLTDSPPAPLLGRLAPTGQIAARLALKFDAVLFYATLERLPKARFRIIVRPRLAVERTDDLDQDVAALTRRINEAIGRDIDARPEQWLWLHRRWGKSLPAPLAEEDA